MPRLGEDRSDMCYPAAYCLIHRQSFRGVHLVTSVPKVLRSVQDGSFRYSQRSSSLNLTAFDIPIIQSTHIEQTNILLLGTIDFLEYAFQIRFYIYRSLHKLCNPPASSIDLVDLGTAFRQTCHSIHRGGGYSATSECTNSDPRNPAKGLKARAENHFPPGLA